MRGDKRERILRVLLNSNGNLSKSKLSKEAGCTRQWVIQFLRGLERKGLAKGTHVPDKWKLLNYWAALPRRTKFRSYMVKEPLGLLKTAKRDYALTTYQAENIVQHYLFPSRVDLYIKEENLMAWHSVMSKNGLYGGGNVRLIITDNHIMYAKRKLDNLQVVSLPQLIVDLIKEGGPCLEAAEMLAKKL